MTASITDTDSNPNDNHSDDDNNKNGSIQSSTTTRAFQAHTSFTESIIDRYDGFILDQFGVLHNGLVGLDGAAELLKVLARQYNKRLVVLSNSSSASDSVKARLPRMGFDPTDLLGAVTSGEEAAKYIRTVYNNSSNSNGDSTIRSPPKKKALFITWRTTTKSSSALDFLQLCGGNIPITDDPMEADYIILHGIDVLLRGPPAPGVHDDDNDDGIVQQETSLGDFLNTGDVRPFDTILEQCVSRNLPMICANMDYIMVQPNGKTGHMPGKIANRYEELGGSYIGFGKPHVEHFEACLRVLDLPKHRVAHVGDSLHHDVAGANSTGIDSIFVTGGIHRTELGTELGVLPDTESLVALFDEYGQTPTHVVPMFRL